MATVRDILGERPPFSIQDFVGDPIELGRLRANYDSESDSVVIFLTETPQPSVSVYAGDNLYLLVRPDNRKLIGFHIENWEHSFVPAHADLEAVWASVKDNQTLPQTSDTLIRMLALWTIFVLRHESDSPSAWQPV